MRNFVTVSLPDELCEGLQRLGDAADPPASLQQMVRRAVESLLAEPGQIDTDSDSPGDGYSNDGGVGDEPADGYTYSSDESVETDYSDDDSYGGDEPTDTGFGEQARPAVESVDLLVFEVEDATYGIPIEMVETVAADLDVHPVPTSSRTLIGVADFRGTLTEVHDGGTVVHGRPLETAQTRSLLAVPGATAGVLMTVTSVTGLVPAGEVSWAPPPTSSPSWALGLAWDDHRVITVTDPRAFNL